MYFCVRPHTCHVVCVEVREQPWMEKKGLLSPTVLCSSCTALVRLWAAGMFSCLHLQSPWWSAGITDRHHFIWLLPGFLGTRLKGTGFWQALLPTEPFYSQKVIISSQWHKMWREPSLYRAVMVIQQGPGHPGLYKSQWLFLSLWPSEIPAPVPIPPNSITYACSGGVSGRIRGFLAIG